VRRLSSLLTRSSGLLVRKRRWCSRGKAKRQSLAEVFLHPSGEFGSGGAWAATISLSGLGGEPIRAIEHERMAWRLGALV